MTNVGLSVTHAAPAHSAHWGIYVIDSSGLYREEGNFTTLLKKKTGHVGVGLAHAEVRTIIYLLKRYAQETHCTMADLR